MCKKFQVANLRIASTEQIADALLNGSHELSQFPLVFAGMTPQAKSIVQNILDRVRPLELKARGLECQLDHLKMRINEHSLPQ